MSYSMKKAITMLKPLVAGVVTFLILFAVVQGVAKTLGARGVSDPTLSIFMLALELLPWLIAGFITAVLGRTRIFLYSTVLGLVTALVQELNCVVQLPALLHACTSTTFLFYSAYGIVLASLGGMIWRLIEINRRRSSTPPY